LITFILDAIGMLSNHSDIINLASKMEKEKENTLTYSSDKVYY
jgi:hypothetical protein